MRQIKLKVCFVVRARRPADHRRPPLQRSPLTVSYGISDVCWVLSSVVISRILLNGIRRCLGTSSFSADMYAFILLVLRGCIAIYGTD